MYWTSVVGHGPTLKNLFPQYDSVRINKFFICKWLYIGEIFMVRDGGLVYTSFLCTWTSSGTDLWWSCAYYYKFCDFICIIVPVVPTGLVSFVSFNPSVSYSLSASSFSKFHEFWWEGFDEHITFGTVPIDPPKPVSLSHVSKTICSISPRVSQKLKG